MDKVQIHEDLCKEMHILYEKKNADYGDSFAQMRQRYPNVIAMKLWEKVNRLCTIMDNPDNQKVKDESTEDTLMDIANYAIMELTERKVDPVSHLDTVDVVSTVHEQTTIKEN